jgi:hypothetical protein
LIVACLVSLSFENEQDGVTSKLSNAFIILVSPPALITYCFTTCFGNSPIFVALAIALGLAGGIAMTTSVPGLLVGVAIAAALVPPDVVS